MIQKIKIIFKTMNRIKKKVKIIKQNKHKENNHFVKNKNVSITPKYNINVSL